MNKRKAFSLTELMILMVLVSIALAASIPVITKKHLQLPTTTEHGSYICYYDNDGDLHEVRYSNKFGVNQSIFDRKTDNCIFNPPEKVTYFQVSAVGGGGGGGDSGYTGGNRNPGWTEISTIKPWGITDEALTQYNIKYKDFKTYSGKLYAYAKGTDSGKGGDTNYVSHEQPCTADHYENIQDNYATLVSGTVAEGVAEPGHEVTCEYTYKYRDCTYEKKTKQVPYQVLKPGTCKDVTTTHIECVKPKMVEVRNVYYGCKDNKTGLVNWSTLPSSRDACVAGNNSRFSPVMETRITNVQNGCDEEITLTKTTTQCEYETRHTTEEYTEYNCEEKTAQKTTKGARCVNATTSDVEALGTISYRSKYVCDKRDNYYKWNDGGKGGSAGTGARCKSAAVNGDTYLSIDKYSNATSNGYSGVDVPASGFAEGYPTTCNGSYGGDGTAFCSDGTFANDCGDNASYSQAYISRNGEQQAITKAFSAPKAGKGGYRYWDGEVGASYCNTPRAQSSPNGTNGTCTSGTSASSSWCGLTGTTGYCLERHDGTLAPNGEYKYRYSYDENYLQYGNPGDAGEYKTLVVRSFKNMDTSIHVGRGGAAGTPNSGASGVAGSVTRMGNLISAAGGKGGKGGLTSATEVLPGYTPEKFNSGLTSTSTGYTKRTGSIAGSAPVLKGLASNLFGYILPKVQDSLQQIFNNAGYGGKGGGVNHYCWAGQWIVQFEGVILSSSIYPGDTYISPGGQVVNTPGNGMKVPASCYTNFKIEEASDGKDGALMIKWQLVS